MPAGTRCDEAAGVCNATGKCLVCTTDAQCQQGAFELCHVGKCVDNTCVSVPAPRGSVATLEPLGDCHAEICTAHGSDTVQAPADDPPQGDACTAMRCEAGESVSAPREAGTACGEHGYTCNAAGRCCGPYLHDEADWGRAGPGQVALQPSWGAPKELALARHDLDAGSLRVVFGIAGDVRAVTLDDDWGVVYYTSNDVALGTFNGCPVDASTPRSDGLKMRRHGKRVPAAPTPVAVDATWAATLRSAAPFSTLAYDTDEGRVLIFGKQGRLFAYAPLTKSWADLGTPSQEVPEAVVYEPITKKFYAAPRGPRAGALAWTSQLSRLNADGTREAELKITPPIQLPNDLVRNSVRIQLRAQGGELYYIVHADRAAQRAGAAYYQVVALHPEIPTPRVIAWGP